VNYHYFTFLKVKYISLQGSQRPVFSTSILFFFILFFLTQRDTAFGWHDETHLAIAKAAGYAKWYNAVGADIAKVKAGKIEYYNHYFNNTDDLEVTPVMVRDQIARYNSPSDPEGHLYGAIIASLREYKKAFRAGKYAEYHIAYCVHYVGDLSQPLHHLPYDNFNKSHHQSNDGIVENEVLKNMHLIEKNMYSVDINPARFEEDLSKEISRIANTSKILGLKLREERRDMTSEEAYIQLGHSASLLKAILRYLGENP
jgi:hypothetical protein